MFGIDMIRNNCIKSYLYDFTMVLFKSARSYLCNNSVKT